MRRWGRDSWERSPACSRCADDPSTHGSPFTTRSRNGSSRRFLCLLFSLSPSLPPHPPSLSRGAAHQRGASVHHQILITQHLACSRAPEHTVSIAAHPPCRLAHRNAHTVGVLRRPVAPRTQKKSLCSWRGASAAAARIAGQLFKGRGLVGGRSGFRAGSSSGRFCGMRPTSGHGRFPTASLR